MAGDFHVYDAAKSNVVIGGRTIRGFQEGDMYSYEFSEDKMTATVDAHGDPSGAIHNSNLGTVTLNLSGTSIDHKYLNNITNTNKIVPLQITSDIEKVTGTKAFITKVPSGGFGKDTPKRTYVFKVLDLHVEAL